MLMNGVPLLKALETLSTQDEYPNFGLVIEGLAQDIHDGCTLSKAISMYPQVFSSVMVTMVQVGEQTGQLEQSLGILSTWLEREFQVRQKIIAAFTYPAGIFGVSILLSVLLFTTVLPTFAQIFREMNVPLPLITKIVMGLTSLVCNPLAWVVGLLAGGFAWRLWLTIWRTPSQARFVYSKILQIPAVGPLLKHANLSRYCASAEALLSSGIDLMKTSRLASQASASPLLIQDSRRVVKAMEEGERISSAMREMDTLYSAILIQMVQAGEEASLLPEMYGRAAQFHELELNSSIDTLTAALEPLILIGVAGLVSCIVLSIYLPMYSTLLNLV